MRKYYPLLFFGAMLLVFDLAFSLLSTCQETYPAATSQNYHQDHCSSFGGVIPWVIGIVLLRLVHWLEHYEHALVAGFTIVLAFSTIGLWWSTYQLWSAGEKQIKVAQIAAEAADLSAKAAIGLQLPIVRAEIPALFIEGKDPDPNHQRPNQPDIDWRLRRIVFNNRGNSIAHPREFGACWIRTVRDPVREDVLPDDPPYDWVNSVNSNVTFAEQFTADFFDTFRLWPSIEEHKAIVSGQVAVRLCAYLKYLDFLDRPHEARFCWRYNTNSRGREDSGLQPDDRVPESYIRKT